MCSFPILGRLFRCVAACERWKLDWRYLGPKSAFIYLFLDMFSIRWALEGAQRRGNARLAIHLVIPYLTPLSTLTSILFLLLRAAEKLPLSLR